jgi:hypothetical protein
MEVGVHNFIWVLACAAPVAFGGGGGGAQVAAAIEGQAVNGIGAVKRFLDNTAQPTEYGQIKVRQFMHRSQARSRLSARKRLHPVLHFTA